MFAAYNEEKLVQICDKMDDDKENTSSAEMAGQPIQNMLNILLHRES